MKHLIVTLLALAMTCISAQAQRTSFYVGATGGVNFSKFKHTVDLAELYSRSSSVTGLNGGFSLGFQINNFTLTSGLQYVQKGGRYETDNFTDADGTGFFAADERLHFLSIPLLVGYRANLGPTFGVSLAMGPSFNMGLSGKVEETTEYFGSEDILTEFYNPEFGNGVNQDYRPMQVGFQLSPGIYFNLNDQSTLTFNVVWDNGLGDSFNPRYKEANSFFDTYKGKQVNRSTMITVGYEYHFPLADKY